MMGRDGASKMFKKMKMPEAIDPIHDTIYKEWVKCKYQESIWSTHKCLIAIK